MKLKEGYFIAQIVAIEFEIWKQMGQFLTMSAQLKLVESGAIF